MRMKVRIACCCCCSSATARRLRRRVQLVAAAVVLLLAVLALAGGPVGGGGVQAFQLHGQGGIRTKTTAAAARTVAATKKTTIAAPTDEFSWFSSSRSSSSSRSASSSSSLLLARDNINDSDKNPDSFETLVPDSSIFGAENVPKEQRPVNEYLDFTNQPFFGWATHGVSGLLIRLLVLYSLLFVVVCYPISGATYTQDGYLMQKLAASNVGASLVVLVLLLRIYSGWNYIGQRLNSRQIEYEETGWYDGDIEYKTDTEYKRDKMLFNSDVKPTIQRLKTFLASTGGLCILSIVAFNVVNGMAPPIFDQYDPRYLERMAYDDKLADSAAKYAANKPAYCDSRYYRAVANGGQGCN